VPKEDLEDPLNTFWDPDLNGIRANHSDSAEDIDAAMLIESLAQESPCGEGSRYGSRPTQGTIMEGLHALCTEFLSPAAS